MTVALILNIFLVSLLYLNVVPISKLWKIEYILDYKMDLNIDEIFIVANPIMKSLYLSLKSMVPFPSMTQQRRLSTEPRNAQTANRGASGRWKQIALLRIDFDRSGFNLSTDS